MKNNVKYINMIKLMINLYFSACVGSWGKECRNNCVFGRYGLGCRKRCNCTYQQICDPKQGCIKTFEGK